MQYEKYAVKPAQFTYAYLPEPDATMHDFGVSSPEAKAKINSINTELEKLYTHLDSTLFVITADHGQADIEGYVEFYKDKELNDMLKCPPYLDAKSPAFIVKKDKREQFEQAFKQKYGKDFSLFKSADLISQGHFGKAGDYGYLLGDYIAIGTYYFYTIVHSHALKVITPL